jgi:hypothetical protein
LNPAQQLVESIRGAVRAAYRRYDNRKGYGRERCIIPPSSGGIIESAACIEFVRLHHLICRGMPRCGCRLFPAPVFLVHGGGSFGGSLSPTIAWNPHSSCSTVRRNERCQDSTWMVCGGNRFYGCFSRQIAFTIRVLLLPFFMPSSFAELSVAFSLMVYDTRLQVRYERVPGSRERGLSQLPFEKWRKLGHAISQGQPPFKPLWCCC